MPKIHDTFARATSALYVRHPSHPDALFEELARKYKEAEVNLGSTQAGTAFWETAMLDEPTGILDPKHEWIRYWYKHNRVLQKSHEHFVALCEYLLQVPAASEGVTQVYVIQDHSIERRKVSHWILLGEVKNETLSLITDALQKRALYRWRHGHMLGPDLCFDPTPDNSILRSHVLFGQGLWRLKERDSECSCTDFRGRHNKIEEKAVQERGIAQLLLEKTILIQEEDIRIQEEAIRTQKEQKERWLQHQLAMEKRREEDRLLREDRERRRQRKLERLRQRNDQTENRPIRRENISDEVKELVWRRDEGRCIRCGSNQRLEFDHIIPVSEGGSSTTRNLQLLCEFCNRSKGASLSLD
jgi:5-methylcytosine-specific restriction endonuclease McrA